MLDCQRRLLVEYLSRFELFSPKFKPAIPMMLSLLRLDARPFIIKSSFCAYYDAMIDKSAELIMPVLLLSRPISKKFRIAGCRSTSRFLKIL